MMLRPSTEGGGGVGVMYYSINSIFLVVDFDCEWCLRVRDVGDAVRLLSFQCASAKKKKKRDLFYFEELLLLFINRACRC